MKKIFFCIGLWGGTVILFTGKGSAQNPLIGNQFSADPSARVFGDSIYVYPSHDILAKPGHGRVGWFCMEDYHVFSSADLTHWRDHGMVVSQYGVPWVDSLSYSMWAPDCIYRGGKYYFYFPAQVKGGNGRSFGVGVAIADEPYGPFIPQDKPIEGVHGIDPNVFIDKDGQAYLYWAQGELYVAKLKSNMLELASEPEVIKNLPEKGLKEGPWLFERNGIYYLTYPHVAERTEQLEYAIGDNPMGPFKVTGVIMDASGDCWTNHQSVAEYRGQWYLFYHHDDYSPRFDKARSIRADSLFFNGDGTIKKVMPTLRGIGVTKASGEIQIDRYSAVASEGASLAFLDTADTFKGWKMVLSKPGAWAQYNTIDFGNRPGTIRARIESNTGGVLEVRLDEPNGPLVAELEIPKTEGWKVLTAPVAGIQPGRHGIVVVQKGSAVIGVDWLSFK